ncbi:MAG: polysaccharide biosynthesis/export family protein [Adhaeribacter sp.]
MFKTAGSVNVDKLKQSLNNVERNYLIQPNDYLDVRVYTNKGERIFDPNGELPFGVPGSTGTGIGSRTGTSGATSRTTTSGRTGGAAGQQANSTFLVQYDGTIKLPMVDYVKLSGLTLLQADSLLQTLYAKYYVEPFVSTRVTNNRVFVLGATGGIAGGGGGQGGAGRVLILEDDNVNLLEILASAGGIPQGGKAHNIKIIRDYMNHDPIVQVVDLSTLEGMKLANLNIEPNDVIYIEPNQRIFFEVLRDVTPVLSTFVSLVSTYLLITNLK